MLQEPVVADMFYPGDPKELRAMLERFFSAAKGKDLPIPRAIITPHAGYIYSGPIAASAYACLFQKKTKIKRVIILAPAHRYSLTGIATSSADAFLTPLGEIPIDKAALAKITKFAHVSIIDKAFATEHSLEVQLPFLQFALGDFSLIPLLVGACSANEIAVLLEKLVDDESTLIVVSSDLSHYHDYKTAERIDSETIANILDLNMANLSGERACGYIPISGLLMFAKNKAWKARLIDLRNSGDTAGDKNHVVGYAAIHFD
ncbi:MAG: AmmeMemoRadiSam system protein B [Gammaproteobacteria bacterium]